MQHSENAHTKFQHAFRNMPSDELFADTKALAEMVDGRGWRALERVVRAEVSKHMTSMVHGPELTQPQYAAALALVRGYELVLAVPEAFQEEARRAESQLATLEAENGSV